MLDTFDEEVRLNELDHDSEEYHLGWAELWHKPCEGRPVRIIDATNDPLFLKNNIASILEHEEILLGDKTNYWKKGQLLLRFPNDYGLSILYSMFNQGEVAAKRLYIPAKIAWDEEVWEIDKEFACKYIQMGANFTDLSWLEEILVEVMEIDREGLWGLSSAEYDVIWKMRLGF